MALKPWYKVITPREDLREGKPLDASEFAVHLDQIKDGKAPPVYQVPEKFFERTYLTKTLRELSSEVVRRLSGLKVETNAVFNMTTQFGGGKTHALALLYHLAKGGTKVKEWNGVNSILEKAQIKEVVEADIAIFVGQKFDPRGGDDGTPLRKTPWGEIAWQLGGVDAFKIMSKYDEDGIAPGGDTISKILSKKKPTLILIDELMNYVSRYRKSGLSSQLYNFLQNLTEEARSHNNVVLAVSIPASEFEMSAEDESDYTRFKKLLDRLGKAVIMSAEEETSEIIRRRLFEWYGLPDDAKKTAGEYADWIMEHKQQIPNWFPVDNAREVFMSSYPFHPMVLSVFQRKWQALPRFQQTRGILRLLALWVSKAYLEGYKGAHKDLLISLGSAPLEDPMFRAAAFEQLGENRLEGAVTTDIVGKKEAHSVRLDKEAVETIKKAMLHQKVATTIFFESNGGQSKAEATLPEVRLAVAEPELDIGNIETVLETLTDACYFLLVEKNKYRFSLKENLNKRFSDKKAAIQHQKIEERVRAEVQKIFSTGTGVEKIYFPERSNQIPDRAVVIFIVLSPEQSLQDSKKTIQMINQMSREYGTSSRTFKSALIWCVPDNSGMLYDEARKLLAWEDIDSELNELHLDETQKNQLPVNLKKAQRDLKESVWNVYNKVILLGKNNEQQVIDLGRTHSSSAESIITFILNRLKQESHIEEGISPNFLVRNWPPAFIEWSTKSVRNTFFASPQFPRLINPEIIKDTIARGVNSGILGYVGKKGDEYNPLFFGSGLNVRDVEISDDMFIITKEIAEAYKNAKSLPVQSEKPEETKEYTGQQSDVKPASRQIGEEQKFPLSDIKKYTNIKWTGEVPSQKWMNFYTRVLSKFATGNGLKVTINIDISQPDGISTQKIEEIKVALRELGLDDKIEIE